MTFFIRVVCIVWCVLCIVYCVMCIVYRLLGVGGAVIALLLFVLGYAVTE